MWVNGLIGLLVQFLAGPKAEPLSGLDCTTTVAGAIWPRHEKGRKKVRKETEKGIAVI